jgi:hypothetical protein
MDTITGKVVNVKRHGHTFYGNPMMSVALDSDPWAWHRLSNDASLAYGIENSEYRDESHTFALTRAGRISHVVREG